MPRKRQIDPDFFVDEEISELSPHARLFYIGTWCHAEDTGILELKFNQLRAKIFPYDQDIDIKEIYEELKDSGKLIEYSRNGKDCFFIKGFHKRQSIQHPSCSFLPLPPDPIRKMIPEKIVALNKYNGSMSGMVGLNEGSHRVELNRVELNRVELDGNSISSDDLKILKAIFPKKQDEQSLRIHLKNRGIQDHQIDLIVKIMFSKEKSHEMSEM